MGNDPHSSVVDRWNRAHEVANCLGVTTRVYFAAFPADRGDPGVDLADGQLVQALAFGFGAGLLQAFRSWGEAIDVILNAHDDDGRQAPAAEYKRSVFLACPSDDLPELGSGC